MKKYINRNFFWADLFIEQLSKLGIKHVCISPGSRNTPLTLAFAQNKKFKKFIHVDERSSGFFALGIAKRIKKPVVLLTTSGTAVAELYPSIIEAYNQRIPLIVCTADRPAYLRETGANQTINQNNIFKNHIREFWDFGLPNLNKKNLMSLVNKTNVLCETSIFFNPGPIHFNFPFKKPLEPTTFSDKISFQLNDFKYIPKLSVRKKNDNNLPKLITKLKNVSRPLIHLGWGIYNKNMYSSILELCKKSYIPILVDGTSDLRFINKNNKIIITNHSSFINHIAEEPDLIIQFGNAPTSQQMLKYLEHTNASKFLINEHGDVKDPSRNKGMLVHASSNFLIEQLIKNDIGLSEWKKWSGYIISKDRICEKEKLVIDKSNFIAEPKIINEFLDIIPNNSNIFISNSLPIRDFDFFASKRKKNFKIFVNRGASGIDGIISTASGIAIESKNPTFLLIGDLSFYHNLSALSTLKELNIPIKILLANNNGGGIFNMLQVKESKEHFKEYFTTPQDLNFSKIVKAFGGKYANPKSWKNFRKYLKQFIEDPTFSVIELKTNAEKSRELRKKYWERLSTII